MGDRRQPLPGISEISEYTGIPHNSIYDQRHRGVGIGALGFRVGKHLRFRWEDIDRFIDEQRASTASTPTENA